MTRAAVWWAAAAALACGCETEAPPVPNTSAPTHGIVTSSASSSAAAAVPYADAALPDEADFATEAEREITRDNYRDRLAELERELATASAPPLPSAASPSPRGSSSAADRE